MMIGTLQQHTYPVTGGPATAADWRDWEVELAREVQNRAFPTMRPRIAGPVSYTHLDVYKRQIHDDAVSQDFRASAKTPLVKRVAQHYHAILARLGFLRGERAAQQTADAQQVEEAGRDGRGSHLFRLVAAGEIEAIVAEEGNPFEHAVLVAPFEEVLKAGLHPLGHQTVEDRVGFPHHRQALRIAKGHGPQEHRVEDGEDGGVGSDA